MILRRGCYPPVRLGGLNIASPTSLSREYDASVNLIAPLSSPLLDQSSEFSMNVSISHEKIRSTISQDRGNSFQSMADTLVSELPKDLHHAVSLAQEKGASSLLSSLPIPEHSFVLHKGAFYDALALRYGWTPKEVLVECACGKSFSVEHTHSCNRGGLPTFRHNDIRDITASLLTEVCSNISVEPILQELSGEVLSGGFANREGNARVDIAVDGFWGLGRERAFVQICYVYLIPLHLPTGKILQHLFAKHRRRRKRDSTLNEFMKLSMVPFPHLSSPQLEGWQRRPLYSIID